MNMRRSGIASRYWIEHRKSRPMQKHGQRCCHSPPLIGMQRPPFSCLGEEGRGSGPGRLTPPLAPPHKGDGILEAAGFAQAVILVLSRGATVGAMSLSF